VRHTAAVEAAAAKAAQHRLQLHNPWSAKDLHFCFCQIIILIAIFAALSTRLPAG